MAVINTLLQLLLGAFLLSAGTSHLGSNRTEFLAQVPTWLPLEPDFVVVASGLVEITLGVLLITTALIFKIPICSWLYSWSVFYSYFSRQYQSICKSD
jgi:uncharacterized membrane protein